MKTENNNNKSSSYFVTALALIFITLKLCGVINWSWWWVTAPLWGGFAILMIVLLVMLVVWYFQEKKKSRIRKERGQELNGGNPPKRSKFQERLEQIQRERASAEARKTCYVTKRPCEYDCGPLCINHPKS